MKVSKLIVSSLVPVTALALAKPPLALFAEIKDTLWPLFGTSSEVHGMEFNILSFGDLHAHPTEFFVQDSFAVTGNTTNMMYLGFQNGILGFDSDTPGIRLNLDGKRKISNISFQACAFIPNSLYDVFDEKTVLPDSKCLKIDLYLLPYDKTNGTVFKDAPILEEDKALVPEDNKTTILEDEKRPVPDDKEKLVPEDDKKTVTEEKEHKSEQIKNAPVQDIDQSSEALEKVSIVEDEKKTEAYEKLVGGKHKREETKKKKKNGKKHRPKKHKKHKQGKGRKHKSEGKVPDNCETFQFLSWTESLVPRYSFFVKINETLIPLSETHFGDEGIILRVLSHELPPKPPVEFSLHRMHAITVSTSTPGYIGFYKGMLGFGPDVCRIRLKLSRRKRVLNASFQSCKILGTSLQFIFGQEETMRRGECFDVEIYFLPSDSLSGPHVLEVPKRKSRVKHLGEKNSRIDEIRRNKPVNRKN